MSAPAIRVEGLCKTYEIGSKQAAGATFRETVVDAVMQPLRRLTGRSAAAEPTETFEALRDVSFEIQPGEVVGIIGRNGAGKSTLLKILSRITAPTKGRIEIRGRIASLLEVGTGFHPELTGRENIRLNGAILGMTGAEIRAKFDEIVEFSGVEKFLDTPVKRYSSGMYVRLAFAVAAHLDPEILLVDEVLAVGDAEFQKKCLGKMSEVAKGGRTVVFVSHNMGAVEKLCSNAIMLEQGQIVSAGACGTVMEHYLATRSFGPNRNSRNSTRIDQHLVVSGFEVVPRNPRSGRPVAITITLEAQQDASLTEFCVLIFSARGTRIAIFDLRLTETVPCQLAVGKTDVSVRLLELPLIEGDYTFELYCGTETGTVHLRDIFEFTVQPKLQPTPIIAYPSEARGHIDLEFKSSLLQSAHVENIAE